MKPGNRVDHRTDHKREIEQKTSDPHCDESFKSTDSSFDGEGKTQRNILSAYSRSNDERSCELLSPSGGITPLIFKTLYFEKGAFNLYIATKQYLVFYQTFQTSTQPQVPKLPVQTAYTVHNTYTLSTKGYPMINP